MRISDSTREHVTPSILLSPCLSIQQTHILSRHPCILENVTSYITYSGFGRTVMTEINAALWGKKAEYDGAMLWLPLAQHLVDTSNVIGLLWEHWLSSSQRAMLTASLTKPACVKNLLQFVASVHDIGKATPVFQFREAIAGSKELDIQLKNKLITAGFKGADNFISSTKDWSTSHHNITGQAILEKYGVPHGICAIVGAHHGKPLDSSRVYLDDLAAYPDHFYQTEGISEVAQLWKNTQEQILAWALERNDFQCVADLPEISEPAQMVLCGLVIMADWIASNEHFFPLISIEESGITNQKERLERGWSAWIDHGTKDLWEPSLCAANANQQYNKRFGFTPNGIQQTIYEVIRTCNSPGIVILEAPMGSGKTEAALIAAEQLAQQTGKSGLFFGLPTQATSNGMFSRVHQWLKGVIGDFNSALGLRLVHGKAALNEDFAHIAKTCNSLNNGDVNSAVILNDWFSGRKTALLDDFVVGTVDQFLLAGLKQKHLMLRHLGLSKKVVIIDEVHAYDTYMNQYLEEAIMWMAAYGVPVLLLSATLPYERRDTLLRAYVKGLGLKWKTQCDKTEYDSHSETYPLLTYNDGAHIKQRAICERNGLHSLQIEVHKLIDDSKHTILLATLKELLQSGGVAGIIVNTVRRAQEIYNACQEEFGHDELTLIHSQFIATDRIRKEKRISEAIGKGATRPYKAIIIGTQVLEQSLDIDFDVLITDLAPMDLILQRAGRLHRHVIARPARVTTPHLYILATSEEFKFDKGAIAVYGAYLLMRTQYFLPQVIHIPEDICHLVQEVYGDSDIALPDDLKDLYVQAKDQYMNESNANKLNACNYRIDKPHTGIGKKSIMGLLSNSVTENSEEAGIAQVRNSRESIEIIVLKKVGSGYGIFSDGNDIKEQIDIPYIAMKIARETISLPAQFTRTTKATEHCIRELEAYRQTHMAEWKCQPWLHDSLALIFDDNASCTFCGYTLKYNQELGILCQKEPHDA